MIDSDSKITNSDTTKITILFVDDEQALRQWITDHFKDHPELEFLTAEDGPKALQSLEQHSFDVILLDHRLPGMDGIEVLKEIKHKNFPGEVIMVSAYGTISYAVEAMKIGAFDYISKPFYPSTLIEKIKSAHAYSRQQKDNSQSSGFAHQVEEHHLTVQERRVAERVLEGLRNQQIGSQLNISEHTVKSHMRGIFRKLEVKSRAELLARYLTH